jgi:low temperature requirement protein LtrA
MVPIWLTWFTMDGLNNMYGSASFTYKVFGWIYHTFVIGMGVATPYVFPVTTTSLSKAASVFLMCYFLSQLLVFLFGLTLFMTMPRAARYQSLQSGLSLLSLIPALISYAAPSKIIELWWFSWVLQIIVMKGSTILQQYWYNPMIRPVTDAEHQVERHNLFTIVVMGELFTALMTAAVSNGFDIPDMSIVLGVIVSICFQFIYFTTDQNAVSALGLFVSNRQYT